MSARFKRHDHDHRADSGRVVDAGAARRHRRGPADPTPTGSINRNRPAPVTDPRLVDPNPGATPKPSPINDTVIFTAPPDREARLESRALPTSASRTASAAKPAAGIEGTLSRLQAS